MKEERRKEKEALFERDRGRAKERGGVDIDIKTLEEIRETAWAVPSCNFCCSLITQPALLTTQQDREKLSRDGDRRRDEGRDTEY
ncbi:hypothetical protein ElyMa_004631000 [Elysia marginata]|uniref:IBB domain-containing protein n=1 Tax=Elysia marginata TaxID=1093978 RepID=A0AAV4I1I0_9GAST|nr:hypothetical protein ElyMa_004631000 [Elysia marginata]